MYPQKLIDLSHKKAVIKHLCDLSDHDKYLRFGYPITPELIETYVTRSFDLDQSQWFGVFDDDINIVASVHSVMVTSSKAEMGIAVDSHFRGQGFGQILFDRGLCWARAQGAKQIFMQCLSENKAIQHIARKNNMTIATVAPSEREGVLEFNSVSIVAPLGDIAMDNIAAVDSVLREHRKMLKRALSCWL